VSRDVNSGSQLAQFKSCGSPARGLACLGTDAFVAAQNAKDSLHFYAWHQEGILQRCFVSEHINCLASAHVGVIVAGGGPSGTLYVWNTSSGRLLTAHKAHMRGITCMAFDDGGALLFTGGQDCILSCWWLPELVDSSKAAAAEPHWTRYSVVHYWSRHHHAASTTAWIPVLLS
jgi:pre-rRNA-processing protein IPI3